MWNPGEKISARLPVRQATWVAEGTVQVTPAIVTRVPTLRRGGRKPDVEPKRYEVPVSRSGSGTHHGPWASAVMAAPWTPGGAVAGRPWQPTERNVGPIWQFHRPVVKNDRPLSS